MLDSTMQVMLDLKPVKEVAHFNKITLNLPPATEVHVICMVAQVAGNGAAHFCLVTCVVLLNVRTHVSSIYTKEDTHSERVCEEDPDNLLLPNHRGYHQDNWISW